MSTPDWSLAEDDPRAFFGLAEDATLTDLKRAYARLIKTWKPDKFPSEFKKIRRAFEELEHAFKLEAPPIDLDAFPALAPAPVRAKEASPDVAEMPSVNWTERLHELGLEATLGEMEKSGRFEPRDWLLLAALREAQNPEDATAFARAVIEALRHHSDHAELWHALQLELRRSWTPGELEFIGSELLTLHHHPDFLRRCHVFWMHAFEVAPAANLCPLLDRFLHRAHGKAHQEEASFVLEVLMRFGPALPAEWIRLQTSFYEQIWGPSLQGFASDLEQLPQIQDELKKTDDPAARRLLDFFAAWGRHDLPELHLSRLDLRQLLLQRPEKAKPLLPPSDLFLPASRLLSFRSRNLRGGQIAPPERQVLLGIRSGSAEFLHYLTLVTIPLLAGLLWFLSTQFHSTEALPFWLVAIGALWFYLAPLVVQRSKAYWREISLLRLISAAGCGGGFALGLMLIIYASPVILCCKDASFLEMIPDVTNGITRLISLLLGAYIWVFIFQHLSRHYPTWQQIAASSIKFITLAFLSVCVFSVTTITLLELSDKARRFENLEFTFVGLLLLCLVNIRAIYDSFYSHFTRIFETIFRQSAKPRVLASIALHQLSLQLWHHKLSDNQKKMARPLISDGDVHLAAAIWEAPRNRGED